MGLDLTNIVHVEKVQYERHMYIRERKEGQKADARFVKATIETKKKYEELQFLSRRARHTLLRSESLYPRQKMLQYES